MCGRKAGCAAVNLLISYDPWNEFRLCGRPLLLLDLSMLGPFWFVVVVVVVVVVVLVLSEQIEHSGCVKGSRRRCRRLLFDNAFSTKEYILS